MEQGSVSAQRGTLEDPEVLQNVPGHVIPILEREFDDFETESTRFLHDERRVTQASMSIDGRSVAYQAEAGVQVVHVKDPMDDDAPLPKEDRVGPPPPHPAGWEWHANTFRNGVDGYYYDYVLVHGWVDPFARPLPGPRWSLRAREGRWALYEKEPQERP